MDYNNLKNAIKGSNAKTIQIWNKRVKSYYTNRKGL